MPAMRIRLTDDRRERMLRSIRKFFDVEFYEPDEPYSER